MPPELVTPRMHDWAERSIRRIGKRVDVVKNGARRHLLVLHLDGVPRQVLDSAIESERMPFLAKLVKTGAYHLDDAFWGSPASTPCFQAGLLYGLRHPNLPAYHWYDRGLGKEIRMNVPKDALAIEGRVGGGGRGDTLLAGGGTTYLSLFRAGAENRLSMSSVAELRAMLPALVAQLKGLGGVRRQRASTYLFGLLKESCEMGSDVARWVRQVGDGRHELQFFLNRFFITQLGWHLAWNRALIDMVRGVPVIYLVFGNYDEVSHRRGPFSPQSAAELARVDGAIEELYVMSRTVHTPYDVVLVTDHGHVESEPFERASGERLQNYLLDPQPAPLSAEIERGLLDGRAPLVSSSSGPRDPVVVEAGNFSHVYLERSPEPLEARDLLARFRNVLARATSSPHIGIVAVRRGEGAVAVVGGGVYRPEEVHQAPLPEEYSRRALADLLFELPRMPTAGDLVLFGQALKAGKTMGFAWEFGSHGGLTKTETRSMVAWPNDAPVDLSALSHCSQLHQRLSEVYRH